MTTVKETKDYAAKNSVIVVDSSSITLWRAGKRVFRATKMKDNSYYCSSL